MTTEEFDKLAIDQKVMIILSDGHELLDRIYVYYVIKLYAFEGFYVEVWYQQISNKIDKVQIVVLEDIIHLYESQINISDLFR